MIRGEREGPAGNGRPFPFIFATCHPPLFLVKKSHRDSDEVSVVRPVRTRFEDGRSASARHARLVASQPEDALDAGG